jgi:hypothetical protein
MNKTDFELLLVIPNQVLNLALKQVQGLSNSIYRFRDLGIGVREFRFQSPAVPVPSRRDDQGSLFGWFHLFRLGQADTEIGELDLRFLGKLGRG